MKRAAFLFAVCCPVAVLGQEGSAPSAADLSPGEQVFKTHCVACHGVGGTGGRGPSLNRPRLRRAPDEAALVQLLTVGLPGTSMGNFWPWPLSQQEIGQVAAYVRSLGAVEPEVLPGDPARGRELFFSVGCTACHIVQGEGTGLGPDLSDIGAQRGGRSLLESLLDPGARLPELAVPFEPRTFATYAVVEAVTQDGREIVGQRINEDSFTIQVQDGMGRLHSLRKKDLASLEKRAGTSVMPSYQGALQPSEIDDLVAYLATLKGES